jgi:hypothetical protein
MKKNFKLYGIIIFVVAIVILSISITNFQKQSTLLREEVFDKCKMIALELKHTREYLAETMAITNMEHSETTRLLMPAIAGNEIGKKFYNATGYRLKQVSSQYRNPKNRPDKFEEKALAEFDNDKSLSEYRGVDEINSKKVLRYLLPIHIEEACLKCHSAKETMPGFIQGDYPDDKALDYTFGDMRGAISVAVPIDRAEAEIKGNLIHMTIVTTVGMVFLVTFVFIAMNITIKRKEEVLSRSPDKKRRGQEDAKTQSQRNDTS